MIQWNNSGSVIKINGSPVDTSGSSVNIYIKGSLNLNTEEVIKTINESLKKRGIKRK